MKKITFEKIFNYFKVFSIFSIFTGILYQYISIKRNMSFFNYSDVINDSIYIVPLIITFLSSMFLSYYYIFNYKNLNKYKVRSWLWSLLFIVLNAFIIYLMYKYIMFNSNSFIENNVVSLVLTFLFLFTYFNLSLHIYTSAFSKKYIKVVYGIMFLIMYIWTLSTTNIFLYKDLCFAYNDEIIHINYMNDKYIFLDNSNIIVGTEVKEFYRIKNCKLDTNN